MLRRSLIEAWRALNIPSPWLPLLLLVPLLGFFIKKMRFRRDNQHLPPGPNRLPIIGNLHQIGPLPHKSMWQISKKYGPVVQLQLGCIPTVLISSAEAANEVLKVHDLVCCSRPQFAGCRRLTHNFKDVAFTPYGDYWKKMRKMIVLEFFSLKRVQSFRYVREEEVGLLINSISDSLSSATPINLTEKFFDLSANITFRTSFGFNYHGTDFDKNRFHEVVHEALVVERSLSADEYFPYIGRLVDRLTGYHARIERVFLELDSFLQHVIDDHLKPERKKEKEDMIDVLLRVEQEEAGTEPQFTKENIKAILLNLFLAGADTGAVTIDWAMAELAKNPRVMKKAQDEVRKFAGNKGKVNEDDIEELEYLNMVMKETLRLHPPAPLLLPREATSHCKINGYDINPKTLIHVNVWAIGRDPKYWKDPEEFIPERFEGSSVDFKGHNFEFLPFGAGRRICPGIQMAKVTIQIALANLLYCFDWNLPRGMKVEEMRMDEKAGESLTVTRNDPLCLVPVKYPQV
ncbi:hypothetical protein K2173_016917 [Erythroxylum novogranatense]|uniref:Cytochrome P450 n=1 Tax=Erythroxylum novogranatense TaxID=1862640 RepID=A0AAV8U5A3_9ROSI|nr:hypothetical protein K2173_016917 [Erythroxylum novogranatense]